MSPANAQNIGAPAVALIEHTFHRVVVGWTPEGPLRNQKRKRRTIARWRWGHLCVRIHAGD
eukprot:3831304-Pyramimonas_sp.AAC.1